MNYEALSSEKILSLGSVRMSMHKIVARQYSSIKNIEVSEYPPSNDYKIKFTYGMTGSATFLIPDYSITEFKELVSKTPAAAKLSLPMYFKE